MALASWQVNPAALASWQLNPAALASVQVDSMPASLASLQVNPASLASLQVNPASHASLPCSEKKMGLEVRDMRRCPFVLWHRPTRLPVREGRLQTLEATLRPTLVLPLQPLTVLPVTGAVTPCCH